MNARISLLIPAIACSVFVAACGGGSSDDDNTQPVVISDPNPEEAFFNDDAKFEYVDSMLGRFLSVFRPLSNLADNDLAKRTILMTETDSISCSGGGSVNISLTTDDAGEELESASISFNSCIEEGETTNGDIAIALNLDASGDNGTISISANDFSVTGGDEDIAMNGAVTVGMQSTDSSETFSISGSSLSVTAGSESISISNYNITAIDNFAADSSSLEAGMTVSSNVDGTVTFSVSPPLVLNESDDYPSSGTLTMTHSDGSSLSMTADNGDPATFDFIISDGATTTSGVQRWDEIELDDF